MFEFAGQGKQSTDGGLTGCCDTFCLGCIFFSFFEVGGAAFLGGSVDHKNRINWAFRHQKDYSKKRKEKTAIQWVQTG